MNNSNKTQKSKAIFINELNPASGKLPQELLYAIHNIYKPAGIKVTTTALRETESSEYEACRLCLNGQLIVFRVAKTTPTKIGQFVTIWKRPKPESEIAPIDNDDGVAFVIVSVSDATHCGQFVFDREILLSKNIMSRTGKGGKRAIRLYPPWFKPVAKAAISTQKWQLPYFFSIANDGTADIAVVRKLFGF